MALKVEVVAVQTGWPRASLLQIAALAKRTPLETVWQAYRRVLASNAPMAKTYARALKYFVRQQAKRAAEFAFERAARSVRSQRSRPPTRVDGDDGDDPPPVAGARRERPLRLANPLVGREGRRTTEAS